MYSHYYYLDEPSHEHVGGLTHNVWQLVSLILGLLLLCFLIGLCWQCYRSGQFGLPVVGGGIGSGQPVYY